MRNLVLVSILLATVICHGADINVPTQQPTIQAAIDLAESGDTIILADGTYNGTGNNDLVIDKDLTIKSENGLDNCFITGLNATSMELLYILGFNITIDGITFKDSDVRIIRASGASEFIVKNCKFTNIKYEMNLREIISIYRVDSVVIENCSFVDNLSDVYASVRIRDCEDIAIRNSSFADNIGADGGAIYLGVVDGIVNISDCNFINNTSQSYGGAIYLEAGVINISDCNFMNNTSQSDGGAVYCMSGLLNIYNSDFTNNIANSNGGAVFCHGRIEEISNSSFISNQAINGDGGALNIGFETISLRFKMEISCVDFAFNKAQSGGAMSIDNINMIRNVFVSDCNIYGNISESSYGSCIGMNPLTEFSRCKIYANECSTIISSGNDPMGNEYSTLLSNCLIYDNYAVNYENGSYDMSCFDFSYAIIENCTIANNKADDLFCYWYGYLNISISNTIIHNNGNIGRYFEPLQIKGSDVTIANSYLDGVELDEYEPPQISGLITVTPELMDDYSLAPGSCFIDAGLATLSEFDIEGKPRTIGDAPDLGAFEFTLSSDIDGTGEVGIGDFAHFAANYGESEPQEQADVNGDGDVNLLDLNSIAENWLLDTTALPLDSLQCYLKFNETTGILAEDSSSRGRNAFLDSDVYWQPEQGVEGGCVSIHKNNYATIKNITPYIAPVQQESLEITTNCIEPVGVSKECRGIIGSNSRSVCLWIKTTASSGVICSWGTILAGQKYLLRLGEFTNLQNETGGVVKLEVKSGNAVSNTIINDGNWHHIAVVFAEDDTPNVNDVQFYVDGVMTDILMADSQIVDTSGMNAVEIGAYTYNDEVGVDAFIDNFRIYSKALSQEEVLELFNNNK